MQQDNEQSTEVIEYQNALKPIRMLWHDLEKAIQVRHPQNIDSNEKGMVQNFSWCRSDPEKLQKVPVHEMCTVNPNAQNNVQDTAKNTRSEWLSATVKHVPLLHAFIGKKI